MTDPLDPGPGAVTDAGPTDAPAATPAPDIVIDADGQPVLGALSLEGRAVPALFLVGWIGALMGGATILVSFFAAGSGAARWLSLAGLVALGLGLFAAAGSQAVEGARRPSRAYRGPAPVLVLFAVVALTLLGVVTVVGPLSALGLDPSSPVATTITLAITTAVYLLVVRLLVVGPGALTWRDMGIRRPDRAALADLGIGAVVAVPVVYATGLLLLALTRVLPTPPSALPPSVGLVGLVANLLSAAVLAPIGEEVFFRGFATTAWERAVGARAAIVRGAVLFSFAHILTLLSTSFASGAQVALVEFAARLPVALVLGWIYLRRRSLYASIGLHATFNAVPLVFAFLLARP